MTSTEQYFMVPETGAVFTLTELRELDKAGFPSDLSRMIEVYPRIQNPNDYCSEDWTEDFEEKEDSSQH